MHLLRSLLPPALGLMSMTAATAAQTDQAADGTSKGGYHVLATYALGGDGGWDLLTVDSAARRFYIARSNRVMVVDADSGKLIGEIPGSGVHGVAVASEANRGFITNGKDDTVTIFDLKTLNVLGTAKTGKKPDAIIYDSASKHVFVCNNGGTDLTVLAPADGKVEATIEVGGAPELVAVDGNGRLFTNLEDKNELGVVDTKALKSIAHWPLAPGEGPSGVAVDADHHRVASVCHDSKTMELLDTESGKVVATVPIGAGADGATFDPSTGDFFSPNADGTLTVVHEDAPDAFTVVQTASTKAGARQIALDEKTHHLYLVTAEPKPAVAGEAPKKGRREYLPDSFVVVVVGKDTEIGK